MRRKKETKHMPIELRKLIISYAAPERELMSDRIEKKKRGALPDECYLPEGTTHECSDVRALDWGVRTYMLTGRLFDEGPCCAGVLCPVVFPLVTAAAPVVGCVVAAYDCTLFAVRKTKEYKEEKRAEAEIAFWK